MADTIVRLTSKIVSVCATILLLAIVVFIARESWPVWSSYGLKIVTGTDWNPLARPPPGGPGDDDSKHTLGSPWGDVYCCAPGI